MKLNVFLLHTHTHTSKCISTNLLLLLLSRFNRVRLCVTPQTAAHQAPRPWDSPGKDTAVGRSGVLKMWVQ